MKLTVIILTRNEEVNIKDCIESVKWADEIIIADSQSSDKTIVIASEFPVKIVNDNFTAEQIALKRIKALSYSANDWILMLDADERLTKELSDEIKQINPDTDIKGYFINRRNFYFGKWIKDCNQYPDHILRLFNKHFVSVVERPVHEAYVVNGKTEKLNHDLIHYSYRDMYHIIEKSNFYSTLQALEFSNKNKHINKAKPILSALASYTRILIGLKGYKEGIHGYYVSFTNSFITFLTYIKLLKLQNKL